MESASDLLGLYRVGWAREAAEVPVAKNVEARAMGRGRFASQHAKVVAAATLPRPRTTSRVAGCGRLVGRMSDRQSVGGSHPCQSCGVESIRRKVE